MLPEYTVSQKSYAVSMKLHVMKRGA
jgi:hypothetical protein